MTIPDRGEPARPRAYALSLAAVAVALGAAHLVAPLAGLENVDLVLLTAVVAVAARLGLGPALLAAVAGVLAYDFFFIPPRFTLRVADPRDVAALGFFAVFALVTSNLAARAHAQALRARRHARASEALYAFGRAIAGLTDRDEVAQAAAGWMGALLDRDVLVLLPDADGHIQVAAASRAGEAMADLDLAALRASWDRGDWPGRAVLRAGPHLVHPLRNGGVAGLVALSREGQCEPLGPEEERLLGALADGLAGALERVRLGRERDLARLAAQGERLRTALLSSLSHDLRTPLAGLTGAVTALRRDPDLYDAAAREDLLATIQDEAERMTRFVANLLDMTRLEAGGLALSPEPVGLDEAVGAALRRSAAALAGRAVAVSLAPDLPMLSLDPVLFEQVLVNLLDNAAKYASPGTTITVAGERRDGGVALTVADEGPGLPPGDLERVFDKFYRADQGDRQRAGTGLGLAICRGFVEAMGGTIAAGNRVEGTGAVFTLHFPPSTIAAPPGEATA